MSPLKGGLAVQVQRGLALLVAGAALLAVPDALARVTPPDLLVAALTCLVMFVLALVLSGQLINRLWTGYIHLAVMATWLTLGAAVALVIIVCGAGLAAALQQRRGRPAPPDFHPLDEAAGRMVISAAGLLTAVTLYTLFGGQTPARDMALAHVPLLLVTVFSSLAATHLAGSLLVAAAPRPRRLSPNSILEILLTGTALVLPVIFYEINAAAFVVVMGLIAFQAYRYQQITRAQHELMQHMRETSTLYNLGQAIASTLSLEDILQHIYREISHLVQATTFFIALYDEERRILEYPLLMQDGQPVRRPPGKPGPGLTNYVLQHRACLLIRRSEVAALDAALKPEDMEGVVYLGVPLVVGTKLIGVMAVAHASDVNAFRRSDVTILETIASQASLALRNAALYARTVRMAHSLSLINHSLQEVMFNLNQQQALQTAGWIAGEVTKAQKVAIFLLDNHSTALKMVHSAGFVPEGTPFALEAVPLQPGMYESGSRAIYDLQDITDATDMVLRHALVGRFRATLEVPLRSGNTVIGYLGVYHDEPHYYEAPEVNLLEMLTNQITAALDNAELLQALEMYASEQAQLVHLSRISTSNLELDRLIYDVCGTLRQMMDMQRIELALYTPERSRLQVFHEAGDDGALHAYDLSPGFIPEINSLLHETMLTVRLYNTDSARSAPLTALMFGNRDAALALVPMLINRQVIGIIIMGSPYERDFTDNDRRLIEMATNQIAAQIHNARIHAMTEEALLQRLQQLSMIEDIASQISRSLEAESVINSVLDAALRSTGADLALLALLEDNNDTVIIILQEMVEGNVLRRVYTRPRTEGVIGQVVRTGVTILEGNNTRLEHYVSDSTQTMYSTLAVPLQKADLIIGVLNVESIQRDFFSPEQAGFIKSLAGHAAISIDNARMLTERQNQINTLNYLRELTLEASTLFEMQRVTQSVLQAALNIFQGETALLYDYDDATRELVILATVAREPDRAYPTIPPELVEDVRHSGEPAFVSRIIQHRYYRPHDRAMDYESLIVIPLRRRSQVRDVLCITFDVVRYFTGRDRSTVDLMASQIAGHLENAALNEALRDSNNRMRAILDATRDGIILLDRAGRIKDSNRAAAEMLGIDLVQALNQIYERVMHEHGEALSAAGSSITQRALPPEARTQENGSSREYVLVRGSRTLYILEMLLPVQDSSGRFLGSLLLLRDVTEERELAKYRQKIQDMVLHDLSKPLANIVSSMDFSMSNLMESKDADSQGLLNQTLQITLDSANSLLTLVGSLRDLPRLRRGEIKLQKRPVHLHTLAENAYQTLEFTMRQSGIALSYDLLPDKSEVLVDDEMIRRVFINLLHNAFKFTPPGGHILVSSDAHAPADFVRVLISDTGPGIPPAMRDKIFEEYTQIDSLKPHQGGKGSGIGLAFCRLAVEAHGGRIAVEPDGRLSGACIAFSLPCVAADAAAAAPGTQHTGTTS